MKPINILFIENSFGLAGPTVSLCSLLNFVDDDLFEPHIFQPHIVLSRVEQERYLLGQMRRPGEMTVISLKRTRDHASWIQRLLGLVDRRAPWLRRVVLLFLGARPQRVARVPDALRAVARRFSCVLSVWCTP